MDEIANWQMATDAQKKQIIVIANERKSQAGFSLIEMGIGMMIIGLIMGAIYSAQQYIQNAAIRKQIVQLEGIQAAIQQFETKYSCYPGDCADPGTIPDYTYTGNNDGYLSSTWNDNENKAFWIHLIQSDLLIDPLSLHGALANMQTQRMALNRAGILNAVGDLPSGQNALIMGTSSVQGALELAEITSIDEKIDDAMAATGAIRSTGFGTGSTTIYDNNPFPLSTSNDGGSAQCTSAGLYANTNTKCNMVFILAQ